MATMLVEMDVMSCHFSVLFGLPISNETSDSELTRHRMARKAGLDIPFSTRGGCDFRHGSSRDRGGSFTNLG